MMRRKFALEIPPDTDCLVLVREWIRSLADSAGFPDATIDEMILAIDEACANSIKSLQDGRGGREKSVRINIALSQDALVATVEDGGSEFHRHFDNATPLRDECMIPQTGGFGLRIIKTLMDSVTYNHTPGVGNRLEMVKTCSQQRG